MLAVLIRHSYPAVKKGLFRLSAVSYSRVFRSAKHVRNGAMIIRAVFAFVLNRGMALKKLGTTRGMNIYSVCFSEILIYFSCVYDLPTSTLTQAQ